MEQEGRQREMRQQQQQKQQADPAHYEEIDNASFIASLSHEHPNCANKFYQLQMNLFLVVFVPILWPGTKCVGSKSTPL